MHSRARIIRSVPVVIVLVPMPKCPGPSQKDANHRSDLFRSRHPRLARRQSRLCFFHFFRANP